jgi:hypothetical protein
MTFFNQLPSYLRPRRAKVFTDGRQAPMERNDRARVMILAQIARREGQITRAAVDILRALMFQFANLTDGRCFPSYQRIAEAAGCDQRTVGRCLPALEAAGLVTWVNRIQRIRERVPGLGGIWATVWRVKRTSNAYDFPLVSKKTVVSVDKGQNCRGTRIPTTSYLIQPVLDPDNPLDRALLRLGSALGVAG